jgi:hypothetical protein
MKRLVIVNHGSIDPDAPAQVFDAETARIVEVADTFTGNVDAISGAVAAGLLPVHPIGKAVGRPTMPAGTGAGSVNPVEQTGATASTDAATAKNAAVAGKANKPPVPAAKK